MKLKEAAKVVRDGCAETLAYCDMPREHWRRIRTNNGERHSRHYPEAANMADGPIVDIDPSAFSNDMKLEPPKVF